MSQPIAFAGMTTTFTAPNCNDLPALTGTDGGMPVVVSCWQFNEEELRHIIDNKGKVYLQVYGGAQPPVYVSPIPVVDEVNDVPVGWIRTTREMMSDEVFRDVLFDNFKLIADITPVAEKYFHCCLLLASPLFQHGKVQYEILFERLRDDKVVVKEVLPVTQSEPVAQS